VPADASQSPGPRQPVHDTRVREETDFRLRHRHQRRRIDYSPVGVDRQTQAAAHGDAVEVGGDVFGELGDDQVEQVLDLQEPQPGPPVAGAASGFSSLPVAWEPSTLSGRWSHS